MIKLPQGKNQLYQWDMNIVLTVADGIDEVHFSNSNYGRAESVEVVNNEVSIPNYLLVTAKPLKAWAWVGADGIGQTKYEVVFTVTPRNKPSDYVFTENEQITLEKVVKQSNEAYAMSKGVYDMAEAGEFNGKGIANVTTKTYGEDRLTQLTILYTDGEETVVNLRSGANGKDGKDGKDGKNGIGIKRVDYTNSNESNGFNIFRIYYTDGHTDQFSIKNGKDGFSPQIESEQLPGGGRQGTQLKITSLDSETGLMKVDLINIYDGENGKTPEKGVDYYTLAEKEDLISEIIDRLPTTEGVEY